LLSRFVGLLTLLPIFFMSFGFYTLSLLLFPLAPLSLLSSSLFQMDFGQAWIRKSIQFLKKNLTGYLAILLK